MAILKCKMCGGDLNIAEGVSVCECEYCGTKQTVPTVDDEKKLTLFARANRLRFNNEFDKAAGVYEAIVADFPEEAEAYWGLVLCQYGIEYVDDPATGKKIPTCHRSSFDSVMEDNNFEMVLEYADPMARGVYREEAKKIEVLRRGIIAVSSKEEPYDIFICYKETDDKGERTIDSVIAQDVYTVLTEKGYRVFFSRISLEDKLGVEYEPYIFAALHSAKVMLAFGTDYDYYTAVWVKNEWSRFLQLIAKGEQKTLIPCYKGIDAYDMPKEFAKLQAQDMGKVGAMQDLVRGIEKIIPLESHTATAAPSQATAPTASLTQLMLPGDVMYEGEVFANIPHGYGKASYSDGATYEGEWNRGKRHGHGIFRSTEYVYDGMWNTDKKHGPGKLVWAKGGEWNGDFANDTVWNGQGIFHFENGCYEGGTVNGVKQGRGKYTWSNGNYYEGEWTSDRCHGQGKLVWAQGGEWNGLFRDGNPWNGDGIWRYSDSCYEGPWVNGIKQGQGQMIWDNGNRFEGVFQNDQPWNGNGTRFYDEGCYVGEITNGMRHGQGKMTWDNGSVWTGEFFNDRPHNGSGIVYYDDGRYVGTLSNGLRHGQGRYIWNDGDCYEGEWQNDNRHGMGKMTWAQGGEWIGEYVDDRYWHGSGTMYFVDGSANQVVTRRGIHK